MQIHVKIKLQYGLQKHLLARILLNYGTDVCTTEKIKPADCEWILYFILHKKMLSNKLQ